LISLTVHPILSGWYCRISWIPTEYSLGVSIDQPDSPSNIIWLILLDQPDTHWIFIGVSIDQPDSLSNIVWMILSDQPDTHWILIGCIYWSAWQSIQYCPGDTVGSAGYPLNIHWRIYWSAWQSIQYCLDNTVGSAGYPLDIHWVYLLVHLTVHPILSGWYCRISRYPLNIHWVHLLISLTVNPILSGWYCQISQILTEYSLGVSIGPPDSLSNIVWMILLDQPNTHWIFIECI